MKALILLILLYLPLTASAQLLIEITQGVDNPTAMAVSPFVWQGNGSLPEDVSAIIENDLASSGLFKLLDKGNMLSHPSRPQDVFYRDWRALGQDYLLIGRLEPVVDDKIEAHYQLFDVIRQKSILSYKLTTTRMGLRDLAHKISDQVFEKITNIAGIFSTKILYVSVQHKNTADGKPRYELVIADADGARARVLFRSKEPLMSPAWSPDAKQVLYVSFENGHPSIWRQVLATGEREQLTHFKGINSSPTWSPDGKSIAMTLYSNSNPDIYVMDLASKKLTKVVSNFAIDTEPQWSVDGQSLIFTSNRGGGPQIYQVDIHSLQVKRLTFVGRYNARARPMPDGSGLILVHQDDQGQFHIARYDLKQNRMIILTNTQLDESPSIAANGSMVMYATKQGDEGILAAVSIDGRVRFNLPSKGLDVQEPAWSPFIR